MRIAGIIAEYNPLHSGHIYQLDYVKNKLGADYVAVALSGSYVQRGEPAFFDKFLRTELALKAGADLVTELPVAVSTGSAGYFALGAVKQLKDIGVTDICFGSECGDIEALKTIAAILRNETSEMTGLIKSGLKSGSSYPLAISKAVSSLYPEYEGIMGQPNNMLAIEYINAAASINYEVNMCTVKREGAGYNDCKHDNDLTTMLHPSACMLRQTASDTSSYEKALMLLPELYKDFLPRIFKNNSFMYLEADDFTLPLHTILNSPYADNLTSAADVSEDVLNRLRKGILPRMKFSEYADLLHTKNIPLAKSRRILSHILLGVTYSDYDSIKRSGTSPYIRILGVKGESTSLLKEIKAASPSAIICKVNKDSQSLTGEAKESFAKDINAYRLYRSVYVSKYPDSGYIPPADDSGMVII